MDSRLLEYYNQELLTFAKWGASLHASSPRSLGRLGWMASSARSVRRATVAKALPFMAGARPSQVGCRVSRLTDYLLEMVYRTTWVPHLRWRSSASSPIWARATWIKAYLIRANRLCPACWLQANKHHASIKQHRMSQRVAIEDNTCGLYSRDAVRRGCRRVFRTRRRFFALVCSRPSARSRN